MRLGPGCLAFDVDLWHSDRLSSAGASHPLVRGRNEAQLSLVQEKLLANGSHRCADVCPGEVVDRSAEEGYEDEPPTPLGSAMFLGRDAYPHLCHVCLHTSAFRSAESAVPVNLGTSDQLIDVRQK